MLTKYRKTPHFRKKSAVLRNARIRAKMYIVIPLARIRAFDNRRPNCFSLDDYYNENLRFNNNKSWYKNDSLEYCPTQPIHRHHYIQLMVYGVMRYEPKKEAKEGNMPSLWAYLVSSEARPPRSLPQSGVRDSLLGSPTGGQSATRGQL